LALLKHHEREAMTGDVFVWNSVPAAVLHGDSGLVSDGLETHNDIESNETGRPEGRPA
jgi:hypothetical protein